MYPGFPSEACCLACGYRLRGLPDPVCPECGRGFDPADAATFGVIDPKKRRRRQMIWIGKRLLLVILCVTLGPRGVMTSSVTLTCPDCGVTCRTARYELKPPTWVPGRYPGAYWPLVEHSERTHDRCPNHRYNLVLAMQSRVVLWSGGTALPQVGEVSFANDFRATPGNAREIIESMIKTNGFSVWRGPAPVEGTDP